MTPRQTLVRSGPKRFAHQTRGLRRLIEQRGVGALLFDPGLGKTSTVIDYMCALATRYDEVRVLVVCPLAAVDTWVTQMDTYAGPHTSYWAEVVGGSNYPILQRAETLASRGGDPFRVSLKTGRKVAAHDKWSWHVNKSGLIEYRDRLDPKRKVRSLRELPTPRIVLEVVNIDTLSRRDAFGSRTVADVMLEAVQRFAPDLVVVDESHMIKSPSSNASRLLGRIGKHVSRRIILTGTVMPHSPLDVFGQWRFLDPYAFGIRGRAATFSNFKARFAQLGGFMGREVIGFHNLDEMQNIMSDLAVVAKKEDALDLPPTTPVTVPVELSPREKRAYADMKKTLASQLSKDVSVTASSMLVQGLRLRQITAGHVKTDDGSIVDLGSSKADTIASLVHTTLAGESRVVVFALFRHEIEQLRVKIERSGTEVMVITGDTPASERKALRERFGSGDPSRIVMVAQVRTMSLAVNELVTASHAVFASLSQQRDHYIQARDRLNRLGQSKPVTFWHAIVPGSVDEVIMQSHSDGTNLEAAMLKHIAENEA